MRPERLDPAALLEAGPRGVAGAVLLAPLRLGGRTLPKGTRLDAALARELHGAVASGDHAEAVRVAWAEPGDLHEDEAARRLAEAATGPGVRIGALRQSRIDLTASVDGVLRVNVAGLSAVNRIDPLEVFTLFHGQSVRAGQTVASVKVAPHLVPESAVSAGEQLARAAAPLLEVRPYLPLTVAALSLEPLTPDARQRFESAARTKVTSLGGRFSGLTQVSDTDSGPASAPCTAGCHSPI